jgi:IS5 family transposase
MASETRKQQVETMPESKRPGVIALIIESLTQASESGISVVEMVERLAAEMGRDPAHLTNTVKTQLSRLQRTRGLKIERIRADGVTRYRAV